MASLATSEVKSSPSANIWALVSGYPRHLREKKLLMLLQAYVDDSGNTPQGDVAHQDRFVLAGYVMSSEKWGAFSDGWSAALNRSPKIEYFKMNAVENGGRPFVTDSGLSLSREFRLQKLNEMAHFIAEFDPLPVVASLKWDDYDQIVRGRVPPKLDSP